MAFSATYLPPSGFSFQTLVGIDPDSWLAKPDYTGNAGGEANNIGAGDQIIFKTLTNENGLTVELSDMGIISMLNADANTPNQTVDWYYFDAQDSYSAGALAVLTLENAAGISIDFNAANETDAGLGVVIGTERAFNFNEAVSVEAVGNIVLNIEGSMTFNKATDTSFATVFLTAQDKSFSFLQASVQSQASTFAITLDLQQPTVVVNSINHLYLPRESRHLILNQWSKY